MIELTVQEKRIYAAQSGVCLISDNGDYRIHFTFDGEWDGLIKTARFINGREYGDVILDDADCAVIPMELLKPCALSVGVYASGLRTTAPYVMRCDMSILSPNGVPSSPKADVYGQLVYLCEETKNKCDEYNELCEQIFNEYETASNLAESYRAAEEQRVTNEQERITAEASRIDAETARLSNESARVTAEEIRRDNETSREANERGRVSAETSRANAEALRQSAEAERVRNAKGFASAYENLVGQGEKYSNPYIMSKRGVGEVVIDGCITPSSPIGCTVYGSMSETGAENKNWQTPSDISFFTPTSFTVSGVTHTLQNGVILREFDGVRDEYDVASGKIIRRVGGSVFIKNTSNSYQAVDINGYTTPKMMSPTVYMSGSYANTNCVRFNKRHFYEIDINGGCISNCLRFDKSTMDAETAVSGTMYLGGGSSTMYITHGSASDATYSEIVSEFKNTISQLEEAGTPLTIYYKYAAPIVEYTEPVEMVITENGDTVISGDGVELKVSYKTDVNTVCPIYGKSICVFGGKKERFGDLASLLQTDKNMTLHDLTADGAVFAGGGISEQVKDDIASDYLIFGGGIGDITSTVGTVASGYDITPDVSTAAGGFEAVCKALVQTYHGKKLGFIFAHRYQTDISAIKNVFISALEKWGIPYLDLSTVLPPIGVIDALKTEYTDAEGVIPNDRCLSELYLPKVRAWLCNL